MGTYKSVPAELSAAIPAAIANGYRLFGIEGTWLIDPVLFIRIRIRSSLFLDTATVYRNEEAVGDELRKALAEHGLARDQIFVTSKLAPVDQGYEKAIAAVELSLKKLNLDYIDLYLIHWPGTSKLDPSDPQNAQNRRESWRGLEECVRRGYVRSIGVSNYMLKHMKEMLDYAQIMPAANQFELHPAYVPDEEIQFCEQHGIFVQTYASLAEGVLLENDFLIRYPEFKSIAQKHGCTVAQVLLKWPLQRGWGIIPKSVKPQRIVENAQLFNSPLDESDMSFLNNFHLKRSFKKCWNPENIC